jgi:nicotinamidase-related amidase
MAKRIVPDRCWGVIIDVQEFFLSQSDKALRSRIKTNTKNFARLLGYFRIPVVITLERPVDQKGSLPEEISKHLSDLAETFEKNFFDLTKEKIIRDYLGRLKKKQVIVAGCETDVCVLQSCLGLLGLGYEVYVVEELLFSSSRNVDSAIARMKAEGAIFLTYKSLYYELVEAVEGNRHTEKILETFGPLPEDLPDSAVQRPFDKRSLIGSIRREHSKHSSRAHPLATGEKRGTQNQAVGRSPEALHPREPNTVEDDSLGRKALHQRT